ncbi:Multidrug resistance efflux pump|uniref:Biotin/lipoyl-binding protein n=2 Tax=Brenneria salicis TaxID=55214 RepID=A0A366I945_9GAMM|nr:efflux RND transporter periplasmic adaptor subunit [Brenneria salicis]NMN90042.1 Multidrug resistance efflux pump [Brenneria salicis ATCC 15712 = DSM 30166]RBP64309.1 biotin/lipoyl-binding protein [Brenneria salicis ATCC 15712 = DSM 30166]RLM31467.1 hypothetical protein BHG07_05410 [Brenneria salicis ATCC 15712 = DSM 30166]
MVFNFLRCRMLWCALLAMILALIGWRLSSSDEPINPEPVWRYVKLTPVESRLILMARLQAQEQYPVNAPFESHISRVAVREGDPVKKGDVLLELSTVSQQIPFRDAQAQWLKARQELQRVQYWSDSTEVTSARRSLQSAEISARSATQKVKEAKPLFDAGIIPRMELEALREEEENRKLDLQAAQQTLAALMAQGGAQNLEMAELELRNAEQKLQELRDRQSKSIQYAMSDGYVIGVRNGSKEKMPFPQEGQQVSLGDPLLMLVGIARFNAQARVDESDVETLRPGMSATLSNDAYPDTQWTGKLRAISPLANYTEGQAGTTYDVSFDIDCCRKGEAVPRLGMSTMLKVTTFSNPAGMVLQPDEIMQDEQGRTTILYRRDLQSPPVRQNVEIVKSLPQGVVVKI